MKDNRKMFVPTGSFDVEYENMPGGKHITKDNAKRFWETNRVPPKLHNRKGIYIFGMKVTNGVIPCYVGKTNRTFGGECFTERNINIYNGEIIRYERNYQPFLFFLVYRKQRGQKISNKVILELEKYMINWALEKNPDLANTRGIEDEDRFIIAGLGGGRRGGAPTREVRFFKKMMNV